MEIRAGQRPPRSKPEDQTSLSASTGLLGKCWKVFFNENMEKKINKDKMMKKKMEENQSSSTPVVAISRSKAVGKPWLQRCSFKEGGAPQ